jgi:hypothetical protein
VGGLVLLRLVGDSHSTTLVNRSIVRPVRYDVILPAQVVAILGRMTQAGSLQRG